MASLNPAPGTKHRQLRERALIHVLMRGRVGFDGRSGGLHGHCAGLARDAQGDVGHHRHRIANVHVLLSGVETRLADFETVSC